jgi:hypothetical protein
MEQERTDLRANVPFLVLAGAGLAAAAYIWFGMPHERNIANVGVLALKLVPFVLAVEAIAMLRLGPAARRAVALAAIPVCFLVYFAYFVPRVFFEEGTGEDGVYYLLLTLTPFLILAFVLAHRLGGGSGGLVRRLGYAMLLLQLSGIEDLAYIKVNPHTDPDWTSVPDVWVWADHITVRLGHPATKEQAYVFIAVHVVLALLLLALPNRFWRRVFRRSDKPVAEPDRSTSDEPVGAGSAH